MYRHLDVQKLDATVSALARRIEERFPGSGLGRVCRELEEVVEESEAHCRWISEPKLWLRLLVGLIIAAIVFSLVAGLVLLRIETQASLDLAEFVQMVEAGINDLVLIGLAVVFLVGVETRVKRSRALRGLHELRALAHVIDMHQLTKDPERILDRGRDTPSSPQRTLSAFELLRYLDYSSEILSLVGKTAALYGQYLADPAILASVTEIEDLTTNLSRKIWQKINLLEHYRERHEAS